MRAEGTMLRRALMLLWGAGLSGCAAQAEDKPQEAKSEMTAKIASDMDVVRKHRILFSHHSVGRNLLSGLRRADAKLGQGELQVMSLPDVQARSGAWLVSVSGGQNQDPKSKIEFFVDTLRKAPVKPELAFMKLCYVDFNPSTDVDALFKQYQTAIDTLERELPQTRIAHVTAPLVVRPSQLKARVFRVIGREVWEDAANLKRNAFNRRLMQTYAKSPVFDLARIESTAPDGSRVRFESDGQPYYSLAPQYTDDDGHLNDRGQDVAALEWARFMAGALRRDQTN